MVTKDQLKDVWGQEIHFGECSRHVGPRGGVKDTVIRVRASGGLKTWKRDTGRFRLPVKYGLYESSEISERNAGDFHLAVDCPLRSE